MKIIDSKVIYQCDLCSYQWESFRTFKSDSMSWMPKTCPRCHKLGWNSKNIDDGFTDEFLAQVRRLAQ